MFYLSYEIQHNFSIYNGVTTLEITPIFNGVTWTLSYTQAWESEWWQEFEIVRKMAVFLVSNGKKITFTTFGHPQKNFSKNPLVLPPLENIISTLMHCTITPFVEKIVLHFTIWQHVQQHQCGKQAIAEWQTVHGVFFQTITNPVKLQITCYKEYWQNTAKSLQYFLLNNLIEQSTQY